MNNRDKQKQKEGRVKRNASRMESSIDGAYLSDRIDRLIELDIRKQVKEQEENQMTPEEEGGK